MTTFESPVKTINAAQEAIFNKLSNLNNLESIKDRIPQDKIQDFSFDQDSVHFSVSPIGKIGIQVIEREPYKTIKFQSVDSPIQFNMWIQLVALSETETKVKLTLKADINMFLKPMVSKPLQDALDKMADALTQMQF